jgi:hypothetical protein
MVDTEIGIAADEAKEPTVGQVQQEEDEESNILDEYFMGIEEEEHGGPETGARSLRTTISLFNPDSTLPLSKPTTSSPQSLPALQVVTLAQRISSPPPASPSPRPHAVLPTSYMAALLAMRSRHPSKKPGSSSSSSCSSSGSDKGKVKWKSGLRVVVEVD